MKTKKHYGWKIVIVFLLIVDIAYIYYNYTSGDYSINSLKEGNAIVAGLRAFRESNGKYPDSVGRLVPKYVSSIRDEGAWDYKLDPNGEFELSIKLDRGGKLKYRYGDNVFELVE